jgi:NAD(P) transhydrogenase subunit beta
MSENFAAFAYLVSGVLFIMALRGLSHPTTSRQGNLYGMVGMAIAIVTTLLLAQPSFGGFVLIMAGLAIGGGAGAYIAAQDRDDLDAAAGRRLSQPGRPCRCAGGGGGALFAACLRYRRSGRDPRPGAYRDVLGVAIGAITFTGSIIAFLKLDGRMSGKPIMLPMRHVINAGLGNRHGHPRDRRARDDRKLHGVLADRAILSLVLGVLIIIPIGGADMPVVVSMLNSYSGWAAAGIGFTLGNIALIITGALVGLLGCDPVLHHVQGHEPLVHLGHSRRLWRRNTRLPGDDGIDRTVKQGAADDAAFLMKNASKVIIVPGYGMAVAQAQHATARDGRQAQGAGCRGEIRHPPGGGPYAGPHERAAGRGECALRRSLRT